MLWAIDVPHVPEQIDAKMRILANLTKQDKIDMDCSLKFGCMNKKLLVIVNHHDTVNISSDWY